jgi:hypothetical protein
MGMGKTVFLEILDRVPGIDYLVPVKPFLKFETNAIERAWRHILENPTIKNYIVYEARPIIVWTPDRRCY